MADNQFLTIGDVYNPVETARGIEELNASKLRNRVMAMQAREMFQKQQRKEKWNALGNNPFNPITGQFQTMPTMTPQPAPMQPEPAPMPQPTPVAASGQPPQMPQLTDEDRAAIRGQKKLAFVTQAVQPLMIQAKNDPAARERIIKLSESLDNDPDHRALVAKAGFDEMKYTMDQDTGEGEYTLAKNWTAEELEDYAAKAPNGQTLLPLTKHPGKYRIFFDDNGAVKSYELIPAEVGGTWGNKTHEQLIDLSLHGTPEEIKRASAVLSEEARLKKEASVTGSTVTEPFSSWAQEDKDWWFQTRRDTGDSPRFGFGDKKSYSQFNREYAQWARSKDISGAEAGMGRESFKALGASLKNQQKVKGMMSSFVRNMDFQVDKLKKYVPELERTDARLLNVPLRQAKMMIKGSAEESILSMYLTDISNDAAKLSTGSSASIAELSQSAQDRWNKIHDPNLSIKDLLTLVQETQDAAHGRLRSAEEEITSTQQQMRQGAKNSPATVPAVSEVEDPLGLR